MQFGSGQLAALVAVIREGSFERAANELHVTPSAVSQRIKQLEEQIGAAVVVRSSPCVATNLGTAVYRHALQVELLERDLIQTVAPEASGSSDSPLRLAIAVNADSLATWLVPALEAFAARTHVRIDVTLEDEHHTADLLRTGRVLGAVTAQAQSVQGCRVRPLGVMRYLATASPSFVGQWFAQGPCPAALRVAPCIAFNRKDDACQRFLDGEFPGASAELQAHYLPSPHAYLAATLQGLGWGMNPGALALAKLRDGSLVDLFVGKGLDVPLYWQQWSIASSTVDALADVLHSHARTALQPMTPTRAD